MQRLPVTWDLREQVVLLVGSGEAAAREARRLQQAGARIRLVAAQASASLAELADEVRQRRYQAGDLDCCRLAIGASDEASENRALAGDARAAGCPVHVVDQSELSDLEFPAVVDRDPLLISVSAGPAGEVVGDWLRSRLEAWVPVRWGNIARQVADYRARVRERLPEASARRRFWQRFLEGPLTERILEGRDDEAERGLDEAVREANTEALGAGEVYLVGAGPGDPDLFTFRALRLLQRADLVLHDRLIPDAVLELARPDAELIYVGKARDQHSLPQPNINDLLVHYARQGYRVCRLKGGDPFIFGRGGEELEKVAAAGIDFQVVPGITAASGCSAYAGIPLTHRDHAQSVRFVTGHRKKGGAELDWASLIQEAQTLVFYMGLVNLPEIRAGLLREGMKPDTPAALVSRGTLDRQELVVGTLDGLPDAVARREVHAPTIIIVGDVVQLYSRYQWFHQNG